MEPFIPQFTPVLIAEEPSPRLRVGLVGLGRQGARIAAALLARNLAVVALDRAVFDRADLAPDLLPSTTFISPHDDSDNPAQRAGAGRGVTGERA